MRFKVYAYGSNEELEDQLLDEGASPHEALRIAEENPGGEVEIEVEVVGDEVVCHGVKLLGRGPQLKNTEFTPKA